nr:amidohydrolase family protein [bacterium]
MYLDIHTHIFPDALAHKAIPAMAKKGGITPVGDGTLSGLLAVLPAGCRAVVQPVATKIHQAPVINAGNLPLLEGGPVSAFAAFHPLCQDVPAALAAVQAQGFLGIKLHPDYQEINIDDPAMDATWDGLRQTGLIALIHCGLDVGYPPPYKATPDRLRRVIDRFPGLRLILAHMGGYNMWDGVLELVAGHGQTYLDTAMCFDRPDDATLMQLIRRQGTERVLMGSDWPWGDPAAHVRRIEHLPLPASDREYILYKNAQALLGI